MTQIQKGKLHLIYDTQKVTDKFTKREFILEFGDQYREFIKFQLVNDKCSLLDNMQVGQEITVSYNLKGKPFENKQGEIIYFNNLDAWKIEVVSKGTEQQTTPPPAKKTPPPPAADLPSDTDDLPF